MEPLIKFRLLGSQLQKDEIQHFLQQVIHIYDFNKILSWIFNHFLHQYNETKQHHNDLSNIINIISTIIDSRENVKSSNKITPLTIDRLPSDLIGECSSYLYIDEYINFMRINRIIYCASNSPITLQKLNIIHLNTVPNLNRFAIARTLCIYPKMYNKYVEDSEIVNFTHLNKLYVNNKNADDNDVAVFINSSGINFSGITHLKLQNFGKFQPYNFDAFCYFLTRFPNVTHLELQDIFLTEFNDKNANITNITPKLQVLDCYFLNDNVSVNSLRNKLMRMYSKQLTELDFDQDEGDINVYCFPNLKTLYVYSPTNDSLKQIINSAIDLKMLHLEKCKCEEATMNIIAHAFETFINMEDLALICNSVDIQKIVSYIEMGLVKSKKNNRKALTLWIKIGDKEYIEMTDVELYVIRLMNALDAANIQDIMLIFIIPQDLDTSDYIYTIVEHFEQTHLAVISTNDNVQIIISNKNCKINGYDTGLGIL